MTDKVTLDFGIIGATIHPMSSGVYQIICTATGDVYVGATRDLVRRWNVHLSSLRHGKHSSSRMQRLFDEHGEAALFMQVLERVPRDELPAAEARWIETLRPTLNVLKAGHGCGEKPPVSEERKRRISEALTGITRSDETRARIRAARAHQEPTRAKAWVVTAPDGHSVEISNLTVFCSEQGWKYKNVHYHIHRNGSYKGWVIRER